MTLANPLGNLTDVVIAMAVSAVILTCGVHYAARRSGTPQRWMHLLRELRSSEQGASYTFSLIVSIPFLVFLLAFLIECALLVLTQVGTVYAGYAAARAASVWEPVDATLSGLEFGPDAMPRLAAINAMSPFASGLERHRPPDTERFGAGSASEFTESYLDLPGSLRQPELVRLKWEYASWATNVLVIPQSDDPQAELEVRVSYEAPLVFPVIGRLLGDVPGNPDARFFTRTLESTVVFNREGPRTANGTVGIPYDPRHGGLPGARNHSVR